MNFLTYFDSPGALSVWFMAIISVVFAAGAVYGVDYLKHYREHTKEVRWHWFMYAVCFASMLALCCIGDAIAFLVVWEIMALSSFFLIVFESWKPDVMKAGMNFFIQSHVSVLFLTAGFLVMVSRTGSTAFADWALYDGPAALPFTLALIGFAIKAGFVPFHTWLPVAHPAAPAHISGVMSGVIIKIGIFGIIRMIVLMGANVDILTAGYIILGVAAISGVYGVTLAIMQHNLKKLLAYHSIENIGIIGMGIGIGCIGLGLGREAITALGFGGALLHTLNHALFKSSLFFTAGNVYHAAHTLNVEKLGGLLKKLPVTGLFFLVSAVAICGLPPMNGFVSEFSIYLGLYGLLKGVPEGVAVIGVAGAILALVLIGGLAIMCFTKAFSVVFLGSAREELPEEPHEFGALRSVPLAVLSLIMLSIGLYPQLYCRLLGSVLYDMGINATGILTPALSKVGFASCILVAVVLALFGLRALLNRGKKIEVKETWGCGYTAGTPKIQYTATSFVKTFAQICSSLLGFHRTATKIEGIFPAEPIVCENENYDKLERGLIEKPTSAYLRFTDLFGLLQNGRIQSYILYGIIFIITVCAITFFVC